MELFCNVNKSVFCIIFIGLIILLIGNFENIKAHRVCSHYKLNRKFNNPNVYINAEYNSNDLSEWKPIRIFADYSGLQSDAQESVKLTEAIKEKIIPKTIKILEQLFKVRPVNSIVITERVCNEEYLISQDVFGPDNPKETDLIILVNYDKTGDFKKYRVEASAVHCFQDKKTKRPLVGLISFRENLIVETDVDIDYLVWLALHEISHVLLFNETLYKDFIDPITFKHLPTNQVLLTQKNQHGQNVDYVISNKVMQVAKKHYNCPSLIGVPLEYNGSVNSIGGHWSRKALNTDYMIGRSHGENLISEISLAFFEDSGWYKPDYTKANLFYWGKNKGCKFLTNNCVQKSWIIKKIKKLILENPVTKKILIVNANNLKNNSINKLKNSDQVNKFKTKLKKDLEKKVRSSKKLAKLKINREEAVKSYGAVNIANYAYSPPNKYMENVAKALIKKIKKFVKASSENKEKNYNYKTENNKQIQVPNSKGKFENMEITGVINSSIIGVKTLFKDEFCHEINQPICSMHNIFRGYCGAKVFNKDLAKQNRNFPNARFGGFDNFVNHCPIVVENKFDQKFYGGSCRFGSKKELKPYEKICENCACFVSSLNKIGDKKYRIQPSNVTPVEQTAFNLEIFSEPAILYSKAACIEFKCAKGEINVIINNKAFHCPSKKHIKIPGYEGQIQCPRKEVICNQKYFCKFGCTDVQ